MKTVVITGGAGFIGSYLAKYILAGANWDVVVLDSFTYAAMGGERLRSYELQYKDRLQVFKQNLCNLFTFPRSIEPHYIVHLAAASHVDKSIACPQAVLQNNILSTVSVLEWARESPLLEKFLYFSTDEVFGPANNGESFGEWDCYNSTNPYSASKAAGEEIALAYANTYGIPLLVTHCMNVYGTHQHAEKFVPLVVKKVMAGEELLIHADKGCQEAGTRGWVAVEDVARIIKQLLIKDVQLREKYNIAGEVWDNLTVAKMIAEALGKPLKYKLVDFHSSRPGHDLHYGLDGEKLRAMGMGPTICLEDRLPDVARWYQANMAIDS